MFVIRNKDFDTISEAKTVMSDMKSYKTSKTSQYVISSLAKKLEEEKKAKDQLRAEIEELKRMNG